MTNANAYREENMGRINMGRAALGAVAIAVILFVAGALVHGVILGKDWEAWQKAGHLPLMLSPATGMVLWAIVSLISGIAAIWIYVGIRPRFGPGAKTAAMAGFIVWLLAALGPALGQLALGNTPINIITVGVISYLIVDVVATIVGAYLYQEA